MAKVIKTEDLKKLIAETAEAKAKFEKAKADGIVGDDLADLEEAYLAAQRVADASAKAAGLTPDTSGKEGKVPAQPEELEDETPTMLRVQSGVIDLTGSPAKDAVPPPKPRPVVNVVVKMLQDYKGFIGITEYIVEKGQTVRVPSNVADIWRRLNICI
jgi:hypothetical protein